MCNARHMILHMSRLNETYLVICFKDKYVFILHNILLQVNATCCGTGLILASKAGSVGVFLFVEPQVNLFNNRNPSVTFVYSEIDNLEIFDG